MLFLAGKRASDIAAATQESLRPRPNPLHRNPDHPEKGGVAGGRDILNNLTKNPDNVPSLIRIKFFKFPQTLPTSFCGLAKLITL